MSVIFSKWIFQEDEFQKELRLKYRFESQKTVQSTAVKIICQHEIQQHKKKKKKKDTEEIEERIIEKKREKNAHLKFFMQFRHKTQSLWYLCFFFFFFVFFCCVQYSNNSAQHDIKYTLYIFIASCSLIHSRPEYDLSTLRRRYRAILCVCVYSCWIKICWWAYVEG